MKKTKEKTSTLSSSKTIKLPLIDQNKNKIISGNEKENSKKITTSSSAPKLTKNLEENSNKKINDIINNVNKSFNINNKIISNKDKKEEENKSLNQSKEKEKGKQIMNIKLASPKINVKTNRIIFNKKNNIKMKDDSSKKIMINNVPRITKEKLKEIQERRRKRLIREKKEFEIEQKMLNENKEIYKKSINNKEIEFSNKINSPIEMNYKKAQSLLEEGGMIDAYKYLITHLCKNGMPKRNLYDYCSIIIKNYEKEWKKKKYIMINEKIHKYFEDKKKLILNLKNRNSNNNLELKVLEKREDNIFVKKLDKSRSTLRIIKRNPILSNLKKSLINESKNNKSNSLDRNKNRNILKKINEGNVKLNGNDKNNNEKKLLFNIKIKNNEEENKKEKNEDTKSNNSTNINNKISNNNINKLENSKATNNNNLSIKKESSKININKSVNITNNINTKQTKEENKDGKKNTKSNINKTKNKK